MTSDLDPTTGLPRLPDGQWWEVREYQQLSQATYGNIHFMPDGYEVCVVTKCVTPARTEAGDRWWKPSKFIPEKVENKVLFRKQITDPAKVTRKSDIIAIWPYQIGKDVIEPADILKVALDIMDSIQEANESAARKQASDALLGAYPPRALVKL